MSNYKIIMTGGGTAGHVTPNLALVPKLKEHGFEIKYIGSVDGIEKEIITKENIPYYGISSGKLRRYFSMQNNFIFNYEEICDYPFGNGIRLFNRSEFDDFMLFLHVREKNDDMIVFNDKNNIVLKGNECDGYHSTWVKEEENTLLIGEINTYRNDSTFASNNKMYPVLLIKNK